MNPKDAKTHDATLCFHTSGLRADLDPGTTLAFDKMEILFGLGIGDVVAEEGGGEGGEGGKLDAWKATCYF